MIVCSIELDGSEVCDVYDEIQGVCFWCFFESLGVGNSSHVSSNPNLLSPELSEVSTF